MKKIFSFILGLLLLSSPAHADIIAIGTLSSDATISYGWFNDSMNTIKTVINGNIESINIKDATINSSDIATAANPLKRDGENIGEYVYSGCTIATSADLSSTITAGVSYVKNDDDGYLHRVETAATAKTFTASKDTYVYLTFAGAFVYQEVANGASQPSDPANTIILAKVVTDGTTVASVTDLRRTIPTNLRIYNDYASSVYVSYDTASSIHITPGELELGSTGKMRSETGLTKLDFSTDLGTGDTEAANSIYYVWAYPDPDNSTGFKGKISASSSDVTGIIDERMVGWFWNDNSSNISPDCVGGYKGKGANVPNAAQYIISNDSASTSTTWTEIPGMTVHFYSSGRPMEFRALIGALCNNGAMEWHTMFNLDGVDILPSETESDTGPAGGGNIQHVNEYIKRGLDPGHHVLKLRYKVESGGDLTIKYRRISAKEL